MNIYSIEEIVKASNNFLHKNINTSKEKIINNNNNTKNELEKTPISEKKNDINKEAPLVLKNEKFINNNINSFNYNIKIKPAVKNHIVNELYYFIKKKIKKNTLKLILDEQLEIRNFKNKIIFLKKKEQQLKIDYQVLKNNYELISKHNSILKDDNLNLQNNLDEAIKDKIYLEIESKNFKIKIEDLENNNKILHSNLNNFDQISSVKEQLERENREFQINLSEQKLNLEKLLNENKSFEIINSELKNTVLKHIANYQKLQEKINLLENSKISKSDADEQKVKFYQDENVRLSSELILTRKKNETIKINLDNIELEKQNISNKIIELNNAITEKSNIIASPIIKKNPFEPKKEISKLNDKEQQSLDEVINRIFSKI